MGGGTRFFFPCLPILDEKADIKTHLFKSKKSRHHAFRQNDIQPLTQVLVLPSYTHFHAFLKVFITKGICES